MPSAASSWPGGALALAVDQLLAVGTLRHRRVRPLAKSAVTDGSLDTALIAHVLGTSHVMAFGTAMPFSARRPLRLLPGGQQVPYFLHADRLKTVFSPAHVSLPMNGPSGQVTSSPWIAKLSPISFTGTFAAVAT